MAITTDNEKLAVINFRQHYLPPIVLNPGVIGLDDARQLIWGYPGELFPPAEPDRTLEIPGTTDHYLLVPAENRSVLVPSDDRVVLIPASTDHYLLIPADTPAVLVSADIAIRTVLIS